MRKKTQRTKRTADKGEPLRDKSVTLKLDLKDPKTRRQLAKIGRSMTRFRENLEAGRRRARAQIMKEMLNRGQIPFFIYR